MKKATPVTEQQWVQQQIATLAAVLAANKSYDAVVAVEVATDIWEQSEAAAARYLASRDARSTEAY